MAFPAHLISLLKGTTPASALTALGAEPARTTVTDTEVLAGSSGTVRGITPAMLKNAANRAGTTAARPTTATVGFSYYDTTLNKPVWLKTAPSTWVDATGTAA